MGMFDYISAKCPTANCTGRLLGQTKAGDCCLGTFEVGGEVDARTALAVDGEELVCEACGCTALVRCEPPARVRALLVVTAPGDVESTVREAHYHVTSVLTEELLGHPRYLTRRFLKSYESRRPETEEAYMAVQRRYVQGDEPTDFTAIDGDRTVTGTVWHTYRDRDKSGAV